MNNVIQAPNESNDNEQGNEEDLSPDEIKRQRLENERTTLLSRLEVFNLEDIRTKVAFILNQYPATRDSDIALTEKFWKTFHAPLVRSDSVPFENLYYLPRFTSISRVRAKIQNEYGLYKARESITNRRAELEEENRTSQTADKPTDSSVSIYCDESGKNKQYNLVGSLWINDGYRMFKVYQDLRLWKEEREIDKELHFTNLNAQDKPIIKEFIKRVLGQSDAFGFKAVILNSHNVRGISLEDRIYRLHYQLIVQGIEHEVQTGRFDLPRIISVTKDKDEGTDNLRLPELKQKLKTECQAYFDNKILVDDVKAEESHASLFIQLTDLFTASLNRKLNSPGSNYKDELADEILNLLGIENVSPTQSSSHDFATIIWL